MVVLVLAGLVYFGGSFLNGHGAAPQQATSQGIAPEQDAEVHFVASVLDDVQATWRAQIPGYQDARLELFRSAIASACGTATTAVGPFYCPGDRQVYIDLAFYDELRTRLGAPGDFAQAYVIAHEVGHHVQNQLGLLAANGSIANELQADCLAGAWAQSAGQRGILEVGDVDEALNAAAQIGDDTLQRRSQGYVQRETWTHGSSAQRSGSFRNGMQGGLAACGVASRGKASR